MLPQLETAFVSISGGQRPAVRIQADFRKLAAYGLNMGERWRRQHSDPPNRSGTDPYGVAHRIAPMSHRGMAAARYDSAYC